MKFERGIINDHHIDRNLTYVGRIVRTNSMGGEENRGEKD